MTVWGQTADYTVGVVKLLHTTIIEGLRVKYSTQGSSFGLDIF